MNAEKEKKIGLALGGGAVLGAAHVGVLQVIEEYDLEITHVSGTSIGAFVAAFVAFGKGWREIREFSSELRWLDLTGISLSRFALLSNEKLGNLIVKHLGERNIEDADIPLAMVATDVTNGKRVVLKKGPVAKAVMASTCIPGIFIPVELDDMILVDGGVVEGVPVEALKELGAKKLVGVDLNAEHNYGHPENILDVIINSFRYTMRAAAELQTKNADILITPDLSEFNRSSMDQVGALMEKGYEDAKKQLKKVFEKK